ncbi:MAG: hypothetical protein APF76_14315 [Desulfitibacter sp. BRH_c19]|nr:MAG: hypothetical protein APF76_14315 [Desulfitibacter sp. BRH_c19]
MLKKHGWMMILCLIPMIAVVFFFGRVEGFNWTWLILLLCPLMHIFMMKSMHNNEDCEDSKEKPVKDSGSN